MRILYYVAYPERLAGAVRSLAELITNLPPHVSPIVVVAADGPVAELFREAGIRCRIVPPPAALRKYGIRYSRFGPLRTLRMAGALARYTLRLRRVIREEEPDIVHVNGPRGGVQAGLAAKLARRPLVQHLRGEFSHGRRVRAIFENLPDRIITVSDGARATLGSAGRRRAVTVYNGIQGIPAGSGVPWLDAHRRNGRVVACTFASIVPFKGHHHLLEAVAEVNRSGFGDRLVMVCVGDFVDGYGYYHRWLERIRRQLALENVVFTGWQKDPFPFYRSAHIEVLPSISREEIEIEGESLTVKGNEGFPRTHLEAMSAGLPVIGTRISGVPEQVEDGVTGILVEPGDPSALAEALMTLIRDEPRRTRMGRAARERVERLFSTRAYVDGVMGVYGGLLDGR